MRKLMKVMVVTLFIVVLSSIFIKPKSVIADSGTCADTMRKTCVIGEYVQKNAKFEIPRY